VAKESPLGLYKGLGAVVTGIVPKMAIRFASFEAYKDFLQDKSTGKVSSSNIFLGELTLEWPKHGRRNLSLCARCKHYERSRGSFG
jgi:hypothetical protein